MITHVVLVQLKAGIQGNEVLTALARFGDLRRRGFGIVDIQVGKSSHPDYAYSAIIRFMNQHTRGVSLHHEPYKGIIKQLDSLCQAVAAFDIDGDELRELGTQEDGKPYLAYGHFMPSTEERLRKLVTLCLAGDGCQISGDLVILNQSPFNTGVDIVYFEMMVAQEFDFDRAESVFSSLEPLYTFGDMLRFIESRLKEKL